MRTVEPRPLRIIAAELEARERTERSGARRFDYAALARRARARAGHPEARTDEEAPGPESDLPAYDGLPLSAAASQEDPGDERRPPSLRQAGPGSKSIDLSERIARATLPVVDAMYRTQGQFIELAATLATEIASFCGDPSIAANGNWNVQLPLDSKIVPDTVLYLSLSPFHLSLRFDTQNARSRQLLLDHSTLLERELDSLLRAWSAARDIELTVW